MDMEKQLKFYLSLNLKLLSQFEFNLKIETVSAHPYLPSLEV